MDNLRIYNIVKACPPTAMKPILGGRLKGKSDINPVWRIKVLTEQFGVVGIGWYYDINKMWTESGSDGIVAAFVEISLYIKVDSEWSKPIKGVGGNAFVDKETKGLYTNDECFKMALTDALGVACKAIGIAADVYWEQDKSKYDPSTSGDENTPISCTKCGAAIKGVIKDGKRYVAQEVSAQLDGLCTSCYKLEKDHGA